jgi:hypothetical protein
LKKKCQGLTAKNAFLVLFDGTFFIKCQVCDRINRIEKMRFFKKTQKMIFFAGFEGIV